MNNAIACLGAANIDRKAHALQPIVLGSSNPVRVSERPGGVARNVCENLARLGCQAGLFAPLGQDEPGDLIADGLAELGVAMAPIDRMKRLSTASYTALTDQRGELVVGLADMAICDALTAEHFERASDFLAGFHVWFLDANLPEPLIRTVADACPRNITLAADSVSVAKAERLTGILSRLDMLFCNAQEAAAIAGNPIHAPLDVITVASALHERGAGTVVVSQGSAGCYVAAPGVDTFIPAYMTDVKDVTGAGDALTAGTLSGLAGGLSIEQAVRRGLAAASLTCLTIHTVSPSMSMDSIDRVLGDG